MSAWILEMKSINQLVNGLKENGYLGIEGQQLLDMNCKAVNYRYGETSDIPFERVPVEPITLVALIKKISCYLYQCSEGKVPSCTLYKRLEEIKKELCEKFVEGTDAYDKAEWN